MSFETFFGSDNFNILQTVIPQKGSKNGLLIFRIIVFIILVIGFAGSIYCADKYSDNHMWLPYFTNQTFVAIMIYFLLGIIFIIYEKKGKLNPKTSNSFLHTILHIFYNILFPLAFLVTVIYWGLILPFLEFETYTWIKWCTTVIQHLLQSVSVCTDWYLITIPTNYNHSIPMVVVGIAYIIFAHIYHLIYDVWIYSFLNTSKKLWYVTYIGVAIAWISLGFIFVALQKFKNKNRKFITGNENSDNNNESIEMV